MKKGSWTSLLVSATLLMASALAYGAENEPGKKGEKDASLGEAMVRTAYEIKVKSAARKAVLEQIDQKIKESEEILKNGECTEAKRGKTRNGGGLLTYSCLKPNSQTDDFFRSLVALRVVEDCKKGAPPITMTTYSYALPPGCKLFYCCGVISAVPCLIVNPTKPCAACSSYTF